MSSAQEYECKHACKGYHGDVGRDVQDYAGGGGSISYIFVNNRFISIKVSG